MLDYKINVIKSRCILWIFVHLGQYYLIWRQSLVSRRWWTKVCNTCLLFSTSGIFWPLLLSVTKIHERFCCRWPFYSFLSFICKVILITYDIQHSILMASVCPMIKPKVWVIWPFHLKPSTKCADKYSPIPSVSPIFYVYFVFPLVILTWQFTWFPFLRWKHCSVVQWFCTIPQLVWALRSDCQIHFGTSLIFHKPDKYYKWHKQWTVCKVRWSVERNFLGCFTFNCVDVLAWESTTPAWGWYELRNLLVRFNLAPI